MEGAGGPEPAAPQEKGGTGGSIQSIISSRRCSNVMGRTERALRMALGGALIMALTMCDIPNMDYSFKYVGPFLFFVVGTLAPPFLSTGVIVLFSGLFCILLACALATALLSCLLLSSGAQVLCVFVYAISVIWGSFLTVSKTKDMTLIGSYILLYAVPLATLVASSYALDGISLVVTPERFAAFQQFIQSSSLEDIRNQLSHFSLVPREKVDNFIATITSPLTINFLLGLMWKQLQIPGVPPQIPTDHPLDPKQTLTMLLQVAQKIPGGRPLFIETKIPRELGLDLSQDWMYEVPLFAEGVSGQSLVVGARPGFWFIKAVWIASGPIGILRNLIIFAFLGFAVYLLVLLVPPIRRQRDVAVREMAAACRVIHECLRSFRCVAEKSGREAGDSGEAKTVGEEKGESEAVGNNQMAESQEDVNAVTSSAIDALDEVVLSLLEIEKAVLLSGMEPFLLYPGPGVWTLKELGAVRKQLIESCVQTQHMARLLRDSENGNLGSARASKAALSPSARALLTKSMETYELCETLLMTFPSIFSPQSSKRRASEIRERLGALEGEMRSLAQEVFRPVEMDTEQALANMESEAVVQSDNSDQPVAQGNENGKPVKRVSDLLPLSLATTAFVHAEYSAPVLLGRSVSALSSALEVNTFHGLLMNLCFPFVPLLVHLNRLVVAPLSSLAVWRLEWRGPSAWWRHPEFWYATKLVIALICIFACGLCWRDFRVYSWGVEVTERPIFLDFSEQGVTTRMAPWILLGLLTVLQSTYNGTVHRALARIVGIVVGSFCGWAGLKLSETNLAGLIAFCSVTVFLDIFVSADSEHPLDGFHRKWGYAGMVFTYTQSLIVTLATEELGGLTGGRDYLVATRILSNLMGILLAVLLAHLPPLASATTSACQEYSRILQHCTTGVNDMIQSFLYICGGSEDEHCATAVVDDSRSKVSSSTEGEYGKISAVSKMLEVDCKEMLGSASRFLREGRNVPMLRPWQASPSIDKVRLEMNSIVIEAQEAVKLVLDLCEDGNHTKLAAASTPGLLNEQELAALPSPNSAAQDTQPGGSTALSKRMSLPLMQHGNCVAIRGVFQTAKGAALRESLRIMADSISTLAAVTSVELCNSLPAFGDKLMCRKNKYAQQGDSPGEPQQAYQNCREAVDNNANRVNAALVECLIEHSSVQRQARSFRTAAAFVVMRILYHLQCIKLSLDEIHASLVKGSKGPASNSKLVALQDEGKRN